LFRPTVLRVHGPPVVCGVASTAAATCPEGRAAPRDTHVSSGAERRALTAARGAKVAGASLKPTRTRNTPGQSGVILTAGSDAAVAGLAPRQLNQFSEALLPPCARGWLGGDKREAPPRAVRAGGGGGGGAPATGKELEQRWRALRGDGAGRFALLRAVAAGGAGIRELCRAELDATLLSEAVLVLAEHAPAAAAGGGEGAGPAALEQAVALLEDMAQAGRFSLNVRFLGKAERESVPTAPVGPARWNRPAGALCDPPVVISPCVGHGRCGCCLELRELSTLGCLSGPTRALSRTSCRSCGGAVETVRGVGGRCGAKQERL
jgi:hypothetical protein